MEKNMGEQVASLVNELRMGKELARRLQIHLNLPSSPKEELEMLVQKILESYEKVISILRSTSSLPLFGEPSNVNATPTTILGVAAPAGGGGGGGVSDSSPTSLSGSPRSEDSDRDFKDRDIHDNDGSIRKRKNMPRWSQTVRVSPGLGLEASLHDGYSWRKYGQKDILGARYPRGYYRCTYRNVQGCLATKQIQRSDDDPFIFEVTCCGRHTCNVNASPSQVINNINYPLPLPPAAAATQDDHQITTTTNPLSLLQHPNNTPQPLQAVELFHPGGGGLSEPDHLATSHDTTPPPFPSFPHFPTSATAASGSSSAGAGSSSMLDHRQDNNSTDYFNLAAGGFFFGGGNLDFGNPDDSELSKIVNGTTSMATPAADNSPNNVDVRFPFGGDLGFDPSFTFHNPGFHKD